MRAVDLFAGCGGLSQGLIDAGYDVVAALENWDKAIECYKSNFKHNIYNADLSDIVSSVNIIKKYNPDIIVGGPPCQDFSHAGKRSEGDRASLTEAYAQIVQSVKPKWFLMENVDRAQNSRSYSVAKQTFKKTGYALSERVLDASFCGAPQKRKRFFCIGTLNDVKDGFLNKIIDANLSDEPTTIRDYLGDELGLKHYYRHPRNYNRRGIFSIDEPSPTVRGVNRPVPRGYPGHHGDSGPLDNNLRALTTTERARIQTFPKNFRWPGNKTDLEQLIGNAVPVKLAEFVARAILNFEMQLDTEERNAA